MNRFIIFFSLLLISPAAYGAEEHGHDHEHEETSEKTTIDRLHAENMQIRVEIAGPATVRKTISLTGRMTLNQNRVAQVRARFPGIVRDIKSNVGNKVTKGQTLAIVESNESLQAYPVTAPLDGIILSRNTNTGDTTDNEAMFVVADLTQLWAEFFIFSRDANAIQSGQAIHIHSLTDNVETEAVLTALLPTTESASQTVIARVDIDNSDNQWRAGMTIRGDVVLTAEEVPVAVKTSAIQRQDNGYAVYVRQGDDYIMRQVETGQKDREWTEILNGLEAGETYVSENSFIVKADIAKSEAEHAH